MLAAKTPRFSHKKTEMFDSPEKKFQVCVELLLPLNFTNSHEYVISIQCSETMVLMLLNQICCQCPANH